jgi:hypothetical protein
LTTLEVCFRGVRYLVRGPNSFLTTSDPELGWVHNTKRRPVRRTNSCGEEVLTFPAPDPFIIKYPQRLGSKRLLVLGDSNTHGHEVSTGTTFYDVLETMGQGQYAVWAAGVSGYGNLQEYLLLQKIYDEIKPEIVIWQLDSNDISDNVYELDYTSFFSSMKPRPYLDPVSEMVTIRNPTLLVFDISHGARFVFSRMVGLDIQYNLGLVKAVERWLGPPPERRQELEKKGLQVLDYVVREARHRYPGTRFIGLSQSQSDDGPFAEIFARHGAEYWPNFTKAIRTSSSLPMQCLPWDRHWNHQGNRVAGKLIAERLEAKVVTATSSPTLLEPASPKIVPSNQPPVKRLNSGHLSRTAQPATST